jgi:hypothetical protein
MSENLPILFLSAVAAVSAAAWLAHLLPRRRRESALRRLAAQRGMGYARQDLFNLAGRFAGRLPLAGASDVRILDLIYGTDASRHRCIFTAEYTLHGDLFPVRKARAAMFCEPREAEAPACPPLTLGQADAPLVEQYRELQNRQEMPAPG